MNRLYNDNLINSVLSDTEKVSLEYLRNNNVPYHKLQIEEIAELSKSSPASIVRMTQKMGYSGFKEFKVDYILTKSESFLPLLVSEDLEQSGFLQSTKNIIDSINVESTVINISDLSKTLVNATGIHIVSDRYTNLFAQMFFDNIAPYKKKITHSDCEKIDVNSFTTISKNDVVLIVSDFGDYSGNIRAGLLAKDKKANLICLTRNNNLILCDMSNTSIVSDNDIYIPEWYYLIIKLLIIQFKNQLPEKLKKIDNEAEELYRKYMSK